MTPRHCHAVRARAFDVVAAIAEHDGVLAREPFLREHVRKQIGLARARAVELRAVDGVERGGEAEVVRDARRAPVRLRGGEQRAHAARAQRGEEVEGVGIDAVLAPADLVVAHAVVLDRSR